METLYHSEIKTYPIAKDGTNRLGIIAECKIWREDSKNVTNASRFGATSKKAKIQLIEYLQKKGNLKCINY